MSADEAQRLIGKQVMSRDAGTKMVRYALPHGPWTLKHVTKGGVAIIEKEGEKDYTGGCHIETRHVPLNCLLPIL